MTEIGRVSAPGRSTNLVGHAESASQGTINQEQIATRPVLRPGEILEAIPGLIISQHSGEGKANQYYLRGFQLDHGTDLAATIAGIPVNMPTHAHGDPAVNPTLGGRGVNDYHFHPTLSRIFRLTYAVPI